MVLKEGSREFTKDFINRIGNSRGDVLQKIQMLIKIRRDNPDDRDIQNLCNQLLTKLYDLRYTGNTTVDSKDQLNRMAVNESKNPLKYFHNKHKKKQKGLSLFSYLNPNAGNVEANISFFNRAMGNGTTSGEFSGEGMGESLEKLITKYDKQWEYDDAKGDYYNDELAMYLKEYEEANGSKLNEAKRINIREELNRLDSIDYRDYLNMYDSIEPAEHEKKRIVELISQNKINELANYLEELYHACINVYDRNGNGAITDDLKTFYKHNGLLDEDHSSNYSHTKPLERLENDLLNIPYVTKVNFETYDKDLNYTDNWNEIFQLIAVIDVDIEYADIDFDNYLKEKSKLKNTIKDTFKKHGFKYQDPPEYNGSYYYLVLEKESKNSLKESVDWDYFDKFTPIVNDYIPDQGEGETMASQIATAVNKLIYRWYNDGDTYDYVNGFIGGLSTYANWLYKYVPETRNILDSITNVYNDDEYENILKRLADLTLNEEFLWEYSTESMKNSIYECDGPFSDEEYWEDGEDEYSDEEDDYFESLNNSNDNKIKVGDIVKIVGRHNKSGKIGKVANIDDKYYNIIFNNGNSAYATINNLELLD